MKYLIFKKIAYTFIIWVFLSNITLLHLKNNNKISSKVFRRIALFNLIISPISVIIFIILAILENW